MDANDSISPLKYPLQKWPVYESCWGWVHQWHTNLRIITLGLRQMLYLFLATGKAILSPPFSRCCQLCQSQEYWIVACDKLPDFVRSVKDFLRSEMKPCRDIAPLPLHPPRRESPTPAFINCSIYWCPLLRGVLRAIKVSPLGIADYGCR